MSTNEQQRKVDFPTLNEVISMMKDEILNGENINAFDYPESFLDTIKTAIQTGDIEYIKTHMHHWLHHSHTQWFLAWFLYAVKYGTFESAMTVLSSADNIGIENNTCTFSVDMFIEMCEERSKKEKSEEAKWKTLLDWISQYRGMYIVGYFGVHIYERPFGESWLSAPVAVMISYKDTNTPQKLYDEYIYPFLDENKDKAGLCMAFRCPQSNILEGDISEFTPDGVEKFEKAFNNQPSFLKSF